LIYKAVSDPIITPAQSVLLESQGMKKALLGGIFQISIIFRCTGMVKKMDCTCIGIYSI